MLWLELIAAWIVGSFLLAVVVGKVLSGMSRLASDARPAPLQLVRPVRAESTDRELVRAAA